jgi:hypothetical protein
MIHGAVGRLSNARDILKKHSSTCRVLVFTKRQLDKASAFDMAGNQRHAIAVCTRVLKKLAPGALVPRAVVTIRTYLAIASSSCS